MSEIDDLISKTITPIGIQKKNRRSIFKTIGEVGEKIKEDALKAFNAHFPYLADEKKLEEHGTALLIPHLLQDGKEEFRNRVTTASFFLSKAGERGYILSQLEAHFQGRYILSEEFLKVYIKILDLSDDDRQWVQQFLDELLNPVITLTVAEWFKYVETITVTETEKTVVKKNGVDFFPFDCLRYDGRFLCDQGEEILCDGKRKCTGSMPCERFIYKRGTVFDDFKRSIFADGFFRCTGEWDCSGYETLPADSALKEPIQPRGKFEELAVSLNMTAFSETIAVKEADITLKIKQPLMCDGSHSPYCLLADGSWDCSGIYHEFNGRYYREEIIEEVV